MNNGIELIINQQFVRALMIKRSEGKEWLRNKIGIENTGSITDYQYNHNGSHLAVSDSDGNVFVYHRLGEAFVKGYELKVDDAAIWKICWADPIFGDVLGVGTFKKKVAVYQLKGTQWNQIAYHDLHEGSVNWVEWAPSVFGLKLYSAGSEGKISIFEIKKNTWTASFFYAHESTIHSLALKSNYLSSQQVENSNAYPMIASVGKDNTIKIWKHYSEIQSHKLAAETRLYQEVSSYKPHKQIVRCLLWKKSWALTSPLEYTIFSASEDGFVKVTKFIDHLVTQQYNLCSFEQPVFRISQSLTGNAVSVSVANQEEKTYVYFEKDLDVWSSGQQLK